MKKFATRELILWLLIFVAAGVFFYATFQAKDELVGVVAPPLALKTATGELVDLQQLQGNVVVLNVYATWCGPCKKEIPEFARYHDHVTKEGLPVKVLGVVYESGPPAKAAADSQKLGINYPVLIGSNPVADRYRFNRYPTTIVVDRDGHIHSRIEGVLSYESLSRLVEGAMKAHGEEG